MAATLDLGRRTGTLGFRRLHAIPLLPLPLDFCEEHDDVVSEASNSKLTLLLFFIEVLLLLDALIVGAAASVCGEQPSISAVWVHLSSSSIAISSF